MIFYKYWANHQNRNPFRLFGASKFPTLDFLGIGFNLVIGCHEDETTYVNETSSVWQSKLTIGPMASITNTLTKTMSDWKRTPISDMRLAWYNGADDAFVSEINQVAKYEKYL